MQPSVFRASRGMLLTILGFLFTSTIGFRASSAEGLLLGGYPIDSPAEVAAGRYFVGFYAPPGQSERDMVTGHGATIVHAYSLVPALAVIAPDAAIVDAIRADARVHYVEPDNIVFALGDESDPEIDESATPGDQGPPGNGTQDVLKAWVMQPDATHLHFTIQVQSLAGVNAQTGDGLPLNGSWKLGFTLQKSGNPLADIYFVEMSKAETGAPTFEWGFIDGTFSTTVGPAESGSIDVARGTIEILVANATFGGAPNGNAAPAMGDVLQAPYAETQQLVGPSGVGGVLLTIDQAPDTGGGRNFTLESVLAEFSVTPTRLDFGSLGVGESSMAALVVTNGSSDQTLAITSVLSDNGVYTVAPGTANLAPGASQTFDVTFTPSTSGPALAHIVFEHSALGSPASVAVIGTAYSTADGEDVPWGVTTVNAPLVWDRTRGQTIKVAVLDTGIDPLHYDLDDRFRGGWNFVSDNSDPRDGHGHGTHVSGTIAGELNGVGVVGVAPEVELYALKVLSDAGSGFESDILAAIEWSVQNGMRVASMSLGGRVPSTTALAAYDAAFQAGLLTIAAAGNGEQGVGTPVLAFPAGYPSVLSVGAVDRTLQKAQFSDFGPGLDIVAPGVDVRSSFPRGTGTEARVDHDGARLDANPFEFSASTTSTGITASAVDAGLGLIPTDFPPETAGNITLVQRGGTTFADKVRAAQDAGAIAVILYNNAAGNYNGTLGTARDDTRDRDWVPVVSLSQADGQALAAASGNPSVTVFSGASDFTKLAGTSMACPHVAAVAALVFGADPALTNEQVTAILTSTATDLGAPGMDPLFGSGLVNAEAAVATVASPPVITHFECDDPSVSRSGGWHSVDDTRATNGRYCRNVGAHGGNAFLEFVWSGSKVEMKIARGPRGGNAEVRIDGISRGTVDFYRVPTDPSKPDHSGKQDLGFETVTFETTDGDHVFRLNVLNDGADSQRNMVYVDEFVVHDGENTGTGNPTEDAVHAPGTVAGLTNLITGATHAVVAGSSTILLTAVLEVPEGSNLDLYLLDPAGGLVAQSVTNDAVEVIRFASENPGLHTFVVSNSQADASSYEIYTIETRQMQTSASPTARALAYRLSTNVPNPFNPRTRIDYAIPRGAPVRLAVYDVSGRLVDVIVDAVQTQGDHFAFWDGQSAGGRSMPSGLYFYELRAGDYVARRKMMLLK